MEKAWLKRRNERSELGKWREGKQTSVLRSKSKDDSKQRTKGIIIPHSRQMAYPTLSRAMKDPQEV